MHVRLITYESGQILLLCYDVFSRDDHSVPLCYRTRAADIEKKHHVSRYNVRGYASYTMLPGCAIAPPPLTLC